MKYEEITRNIIGSAMQVHSVIGMGFQEVIYQRALKIEMIDNYLCFEREKEMFVFYKDQQVGTRRVDFLVENQIMLEIKAVSSLEGTHMTQIKNYLEIYNLKIGLLINFGARSLEFKRIYNNNVS